MNDSDVRDVRILLVEDDELNRALIRIILARAADPELRTARLVEAGSLSAARAALAEAPFDLVLLDAGLPDGDGLSLASDIADAAGSRRPAVVALTGDAAPESRTRALAAGCDAFLVKGSYSATDMVGELAAQLAARRRSD
jgi:two-component system KDP operon response regulator KdpE